MALMDCPDCAYKVSDTAAACPGCGGVIRMYNDLLWPAVHMAGAAMVISVTAIFLTPSDPWWAKLIAVAAAGLTVGIAAWGIPALLEDRRMRRRKGVKKIHERQEAEGLGDATSQPDAGVHHAPAGTGQGARGLSGIALGVDVHAE